MTDKLKIKRALISVSDKTDLDHLGLQLEELGVEIISTGGTLKKLKEIGIQAISISTFTGAPEILGGRVKTLHPKVHGGILCRRDDEDDLDRLRELEYRLIDLVVVNLYPFQQTVSAVDATDEEIIENIDIGGPTMVRAAAKNHEWVTVITEPSDYDRLLQHMRDNEVATTLAFRRECAAKAFALTAQYDSAIAEYFARGKDEEGAVFPGRLCLNFSFRSKLRYGENPHQKASLYAKEDYPAATMLDAEVLAGKELSYNNYGDLDACLDMLLDFQQPFACLLKHANPCGAAVGRDPSEAYKLAYESDPLSAYGSIIGLNREVDMSSARLLHETPFVECLLAPGFTEDALKLLKKKKNRRILAVPEIIHGRLKNQMVYRFIRGGVLVQTADDIVTLESSLKVATKRQPTARELESLMFAWLVVKHAKSNAIVLAKGTATVGIGMGQTSRVDSSFMAVKRAGDRAQGAVMASDAFFPMPDAVEVALDAGVTAIIQPGGSKGDEQAIAAADKAGAAMVFTGIRHFRH